MHYLSSKIGYFLLDFRILSFITSFIIENEHARQLMYCKMLFFVETWKVFVSGMKNVRKRRGVYEPQCASVKRRRRPYFTHHNHQKVLFQHPLDLSGGAVQFQFSCKLFNISKIKQIHGFFRGSWSQENAPNLRDITKEGNFANEKFIFP